MGKEASLIRKPVAKEASLICEHLSLQIKSRRNLVSTLFQKVIA